MMWTALLPTAAQCRGRAGGRAGMGQVVTIRLDTAKIVCSQSAKRLALALRSDGDGVPDLDGSAGDDHAVDEQFQ